MMPDYRSHAPLLCPIAPVTDQDEARGASPHFLRRCCIGDVPTADWLRQPSQENFLLESADSRAIDQAFSFRTIQL
jgi:hypothetical protein